MTRWRAKGALSLSEMIDLLGEIVIVYLPLRLRGALGRFRLRGTMVCPKFHIWPGGSLLREIASIWLAKDVRFGEGLP